MTVINLFKNDLKRILTHKEILIVAVFIVPLFIGIAVLFSAQTEMKLSIALVADHAPNLPRNDKYQIEVVEKRPAKSTLLIGKYAAIVEQKIDGSYEVRTIKSKADQEKIATFFNTGEMAKDVKRGVGANILGYIVMLLLAQAVALFILYPEDRIQKTFRRILTAPVSEGQYLFAQGILTFTCLFVPTYLAIAVINVCFGVKIGYSLGMLAILLGILCVFSTAFALMISSALERNTSLAASIISLITCVLAGCFKSFTEGNKVLDAIFSIIPQKDYMTLIQGIENGRSIFDFKGQLLYLLIWIVALWVMGSMITNRKVKKGVY